MAGIVQKVYESSENGGTYHMVLKNSSSTKAGTTEGNSREDSHQNTTPNRREFKLQKVDRYLESMEKDDNFQDLYNLLDIDL
jgi:hypothetical protein